MSLKLPTLQPTLESTDEWIVKYTAELELLRAQPGAGTRKFKISQPGSNQVIIVMLPTTATWKHFKAAVATSSGFTSSDRIRASFQDDDGDQCRLATEHDFVALLADTSVGKVIRICLESVDVTSREQELCQWLFADIDAPEAFIAREQAQKGVQASRKETGPADMCCVLANDDLMVGSWDQADCSAMQQDASSSDGSILLQYPYQAPTGQLCRVFISHAGEQKEVLVDLIQKDLQTKYPALDSQVFVDEFSLERGGDAMDNIYKSLRDAFVVIIVLSKAFISKCYPMEELQLLMEWRECAKPAAGKSSAILPVLYDVNYQEVEAVAARYRRAATCDDEYQAVAAEQNWAFDKPTGMARLQQWATDLEALTGITSFRHDQARFVTQMGEEVVEDTVKLLEVMGEMPTERRRNLPPIQVDVEDRVEGLVQLMTQEGPPKLVLLHGMGGIGKTHLATAVFNRLQQRNPTVPCCFLSMELNGEKRSGVIEQKQCQMLMELAQVKDAKVWDLGKGRAQLSETLRSRKVLLVVDNVWRAELSELLPSNFVQQLGPGSMVLVTSRAATAAAGLGHEENPVIAQSAEFLSEEQAVQLVCKHAYSRAVPPDADKHHVERIVQRCGRLPLALVLVGRYISSQRSENSAFRVGDVVQKLPVVFATHEGAEGVQWGGVFASIRLSWSHLKDEEKETLLDVAWFLKGKRWEQVERFCEDDALGRLQQLGLVTPLKISGYCGGDHEVILVAVHDCVVEFCRHKRYGAAEHMPAGQSVGRKELTLEVDGAESWESIIRRELGSGGQTVCKGLWCRAVEQPERPRCPPMTADDVSTLLRQQNLRLLRMEGVPIDGGEIIQSLLPLTLSLPPALRWLEVLPYGDTPSVQFEEGSGLRCLNCTGLAVVDGFSRLSSLLHLTLSGFDSLATLSAGISGLTSLQMLDLSYYNNLATLPEGISSLTSLQKLDLSECYRLATLPGGICGLTSLQLLDLSWCKRLATLPEGISGLTSLQMLGLSCCEGLATLPEGISGLSSLWELKMNRCTSLAILPEGISGLTSLQKLKLSGCCSLATVPGGISGLTSLQMLDLSGCECLFTLPEGISGLTSLQLLDLSGCESLVTLPEGISGLTSLQKFDLSGCYRLATLPEGISRLTLLQILDLSYCGSLSTLPEGISGLTSLQKLDLSYCRSLATLLQGISGLTSLQMLGLSRCKSLATLPEGISGLTSLQMLNLSYCNTLATLPEGISGLTSLQKLNLSYYNSLSTLPEGISGLTSLQELDLSWCTCLATLPEGISGLTSLQLLDLSRCTCLATLPEGISRLTSLQKLDLSGCESLATLPEGISGLTSLQMLDLSGCYRLATLPEGISGLTSLQELDLSYCGSLSTLPEGISGLTSLQKLHLYGCDSLSTLPEGISDLTSLQLLDLSTCKSLATLPEGITAMRSLQQLNLSRCPKLAPQLDDIVSWLWDRVTLTT